MSPLFKVVLVVVLVLIALMAMGGCAAAPRTATVTLDCAKAPCTIVRTPEYHVDQDDANACAGARHSCTEL